jgi:cytochrome P450
LLIGFIKNCIDKCLFLLDLYSSGMEIVNSFTSSFKVWVGPFLVFVVRDPSEVKILLNSEDCFEKPNMIYRTYFSYGMLTMGGETYKLHRKTILPLFYPKPLQQYHSKINAKMNSFLKDFDNNLKPTEMEMSEHALEFALDTFLETMFGMDVKKTTQKKFLNDAEK